MQDNGSCVWTTGSQKKKNWDFKLNLVKCTKVFNIQRKSEKRRGKIRPVNIFHFKENLWIFYGSVSAAYFLTSRRIRRNPY